MALGPAWHDANMEKLVPSSHDCGLMFLEEGERFPSVG